MHSTPFNQLYSLAEDCADRYYTKVIQILTHLMKNSFHDRQLILINTARVLKFLKSYASWKTKLWKVLSKYHNLPDHFHDLKTTLKTKFEFLKTATSKTYKIFKRQFRHNKHICRATTRPPRPSSTAECLHLIARLRGEQASAASWEPRPPFEATEMD